MRNIKPSPSSLQIIYWTGKSCPFWAISKISSLPGPWSPGGLPPLCSTAAVSEHWSTSNRCKKKLCFRQDRKNRGDPWVILLTEYRMCSSVGDVYLTGHLYAVCYKACSKLKATRKKSNAYLLLTALCKYWEYFVVFFPSMSRYICVAIFKAEEA